MHGAIIYDNWFRCGVQVTLISQLSYPTVKLEEHKNIYKWCYHGKRNEVLSVTLELGFMVKS